MRTKISVAAQFRGPPNSVNGGYACGLMARHIAGPSQAFLRAPMPLDTPMVLIQDESGVRIEGEDGRLIGEAAPASTDEIPTPPAAPSLEASGLAAKGFPGFTRPFHAVCFCCGDEIAEGVGLRAFVGQLAGAPGGVVAGPWTPNPAFADERGLIRTEVVWAALDCPGSVAWVVTGGGGGLLGAMTCEVLRRPAAGEPCVIVAWPLEQSGRKRLSGTALYAGDELLARSHQVWIARTATAAAQTRNPDV